MTISHLRTGFALALLAACATFAAPGLALGGESANEFYINTHRDQGTVNARGSRSSAMGGAGLGLADGVSSVGVNPAALGAFTGSGFEVGIGFDWLDDGYDKADQTSFRLGGAVSLEKWKHTGGPNQAIGAQLQNTRYSGAANIGMKKEQTSILLGYGLHLMDNLLAGISVSLYDGEWVSGAFSADEDAKRLDRSFTGGEFKVGGIYRMSDTTTFGGTLGFSTGTYKEKAAYANNPGSGSLFRYSLGVGVAHQLSDATLLLGDITYDSLKTEVPSVIDETTKSWRVSAGVEQRVIEDVLALRGGLYYDKLSYSSSGTATMLDTGSYSKGRFGVTAGFGFRLYNFDLGYSLDIGAGGNVKNLLDLSAEW